MDNLVRTFLELADIDEVYPNEDQVLTYVRGRLESAGVSYKQDTARNIVARIDGSNPEALAIAGHMDIAAPLAKRKVIVDDETIKTDGSGLLGGDDKTAVAAMLELADWFHEQGSKPSRTIELIFTIGEEAGCKGAVQLDYSLVTAKQALVFDWLGGVNHIIKKSPAYYCFDVTYIGKNAHPAEWQQGRNAGAALMEVASSLQQGEYAKEVIFNIGEVRIGEARNQVPGKATLRAEARSYDASKVAAAAKEIESAFKKGITTHKLTGQVDVYNENSVYLLDPESTLKTDVLQTLKNLKLEPVYDSTYGCFDGNVFAAKGIEVVILGAGYYNPHSPDEYVNISEFHEMFKFLQTFVS